MTGRNNPTVLWKNINKTIALFQIRNYIPNDVQRMHESAPSSAVAHLIVLPVIRGGKPARGIFLRERRGIAAGMARKGNGVAELMISVSGVRGIYGDGLTEEIAEIFAYAFGKLYGGPVVVGRDSRQSGEAIAGAVISGLRRSGMDVIDLGLASTPTTEMAVIAKEAAGGVIVTASHNPEEWNGLKFLGPDGVFLNADEGAELLEEFRKYKSVLGKSIKGSVTVWNGAEDYHIDSILALDVIDAAAIRAAKYTVCLDAVNGAGGEICRKLLERLGCRVHAINVEPDGKFPRGPEPVPENITELCELVRQKNANIGFAVDPDVDRLSLVDETGRAPGEEYTLPLTADYIFAQGERAAACNLSTSQMLEEAADRHGATVHRAPVGEINVVAKMREVDAGIGGEGNGGVIYPALHYGRDAVLGMALILQYMNFCEEVLSELVDTFTPYVIIKEKMDIPAGKDWAAAVKKAFKGEEMDVQDGTRVKTGDAWVHIRSSNTEPIIRIIAEASSEKEARGLIQRVRAAL